MIVLDCLGLEVGTSFLEGYEWTFMTPPPRCNIVRENEEICFARGRGLLLIVRFEE